MRFRLSITATWLLLVCSLHTARAQEAPRVAPQPAPDATRPGSPQKNPRFKVTLVLFEADWSKAATAERIERDLQAALKDVPMPDDLRQNLAASGPLILFAPELIHVYRPTDLNDLFVWLAQHKLIKKRIEYTMTDPASADKPAISVELQDLPVDVRRAPPSPGVSRRFQWCWSFLPGSANDLFPGAPMTGTAAPDPSEATLTVRRRLAVFEEYVGQQTRTEQRNDLLDSAFVLSFPRDRVAVVHAFPDQGDGRWRWSAHAAGVEAVLFVRDSSLAVPALEGRADGSGAVRIAELIRRAPPSVMPRSLRKPAGGPPDGPAASADKAPPSPVAETLKVFSLVHIEAKTAASIIAQLYGGAWLTVAAEKRTKALLVRGDAAKLAEVEALLLRLDGKPTGGTAFKSSPAGPPRAGGPGDDRRTAAEPDWRAAKYRELEAQAARTAARYRHVRQSAGVTGPQLQELKDRLRQEVAAVFAARQDWQQAELNQLRARLATIDLSLDARERIKDTIIDRRVEELLNPDIVWDSQEQPGEEPHPGGRDSAK